MFAWIRSVSNSSFLHLTKLKARPARPTELADAPSCFYGTRIARRSGEVGFEFLSNASGVGMRLDVYEEK